MATARVSHAVAGRLRIRVTGSDDEVEEILRALEDRCGDRQGITSVATDARTGSALLAFDSDELDLAEAVELARSAHAALHELIPPPVMDRVEHSASSVAQELGAAFSRADRAVLRATHGAVDLRMLFPLTLGALSVRQLLRTGPSVRTMPWYMLGYYAFDSYVKLHHSHAEPLHHHNGGSPS
jgi:hypothetical protein